MVQASCRKWGRGVWEVCGSWTSFSGRWRLERGVGGFPFLVGCWFPFHCANSQERGPVPTAGVSSWGGGIGGVKVCIVEKSNCRAEMPCRGQPSSLRVPGLSSPLSHPALWGRSPPGLWGPSGPSWPVCRCQRGFFSTPAGRVAFQLPFAVGSTCRNVSTCHVSPWGGTRFGLLWLSKCM